MRFEIHVFHHFSDTSFESLGSMVKELLLQGKSIMAVLDDLTAQVAQNTTVEGSAITLIQNIAAALAAAGTDPAKLADLQAQLKTSADSLAAAITANTPAG